MVTSMSRTGTSGLLICVLLHLVSGKEWAPETFPNPSTAEGAQACGRGDVLGFFCDPESFLTPDSADVVEGHIKQIQEAEYPYGSSGCREKDERSSPGFQVGAVIISSIARRSEERPPEAAKRFADAIFDAWGVGNKGCGNGVLLLLAVQDRQVYIATGSEIKNFASKDELRTVIDNMTQELRVKNYDRAVEQAVVDLGLLLGGAHPHGDKEDGSPWVSIAILAAIGGFFGLMFRASRRQQNQRQEALSLLEKLQQEQETARLTGKYPSASCPICFDDLQPIKTASPSTPLQEVKIASSGEEQPLLTQRRSREKMAQPTELEASTSEKDEASDAEPEGDGKKPLCLPCGHTFCVPCISEWLERNTKCPICRADVRPGDTSEPSQRAVARRPQWEVEYNDPGYRNEVAFRMERLHRMYPTQITPQMVDTAGRGEWIDFSTMRDQMMQSNTRSTFQSSGHDGSSATFGGGTHSGGVGGSW